MSASVKILFNQLQLFNIDVNSTFISFNHRILCRVFRRDITLLSWTVFFKFSITCRGTRVLLLFFPCSRFDVIVRVNSSICCQLLCKRFFTNFFILRIGLRAGLTSLVFLNLSLDDVQIHHSKYTIKPEDVEHLQDQ